MYSMVQGEVRHTAIVTPKDEKKKPYNQIQLLQSVPGQEDKLVTVRDYDLNRKYNGKFDAMCTSLAVANNFMLTIRVRDSK